MTDKNEHPILFSSEMVRAILGGRKTVTRRVVKKTPCTCGGDREKWYDNWDPVHHEGAEWACQGCYGYTGDTVKCPFGKVGNKLWVREAFCLEGGADGILPTIRADRPYKETEGDEWNGGDRLIPHYRATHPEPELCYEDPTDRPSCQKCEEGEPHCHWKPSIHMPRWASRITLEITNIRVERLQDINSERHDEVLKEGYPFGFPTEELHENPVTTFARAWDAVNGKKYPWSSNPWIWILEFRRIER